MNDLIVEFLAHFQRFTRQTFLQRNLNVEFIKNLSRIDLSLCRHWCRPHFDECRIKFSWVISTHWKSSMGFGHAMAACAGKLNLSLFFSYFKLIYFKLFSTIRFIRFQRNWTVYWLPKSHVIAMIKHWKNIKNLQSSKPCWKSTVRYLNI